jgi:protein tyrosine phosphatase
MNGLNENEQIRVNQHAEQAYADVEASYENQKERLVIWERFKDSTLKFFPIRSPNKNPPTGPTDIQEPKFYASVHPSETSLCDYVKQLHASSGGAILKLAETKEENLKEVKCPEYYDTDGRFKLIGDMWVKGEPLGAPMNLGENYGDRKRGDHRHGKKSDRKEVTLQCYKISTAPKDNPSDVRATFGMHVNNLIDGTPFRPGNLIALALTLANLPVSKIRVHCLAGMDRTGTLIVLSQFIHYLLTRNEKTPKLTIQDFIQKYRDDRGEPTAIQGKEQLEMLYNEAARLEKLSPTELASLVRAAAIPGLSAAGLPRNHALKRKLEPQSTPESPTKRTKLS